MAAVLAMLESVDSRHPGLIVYDSLGDNELNEGDLKKLLEHLNRIATGAGFQVIVTVANLQVAVEGSGLQEFLGRALRSVISTRRSV